MAWWSSRYLRSMDFRVIPVILILMGISLLVISSSDWQGAPEVNDETFFTPRVQSQIRWFLISVIVYLIFAGLDYHLLRTWAWIFYFMVILLLLGLFFTQASHGVHRWYHLPGMTLQPSELAKLVVVIVLSRFLESHRSSARRWGTVFLAGAIVGLPFFLILKQPDLGTALVLVPMTIVMFYFGEVRPSFVRFLCITGAILLGLVLLIFLGVVSHEEMRPYASLVLKEYQYDRLAPGHHQEAAMNAISIGGWTGSGWRNNEFTGHGWLPEAQTDSVFPAFGEIFGFVGMFLLIVLFYALLFFCFQVAAVAKDYFGRILSAGIAAYLAMHVVVNIGMMSGLLPITGVPLIMVTYGGSSVLVTIAALGILQSIYSRRFMF